LVWALLLAAGTLVGCSDSPERQAGKNLRDQVAEAQRHFATALELLRSPAYENPAGKIVPIPGAKMDDPKELKALPPGALNPEALKHLDAAALDQAIGANGEATPPDMSVALAQAGRIHEMRGFYYAWEATAARNRIAGLLADARGEIAFLQVQAASLKYLTTLLSAVSGDANTLATTARAQAADMAAKLQAIDTEIKGLQDKAKGLQEDSQKLLKEAGNLRLESKTLTGRKALDLSEQAIAKQEQADKLASELSVVENSLGNRQADRASLAAEEDLAKSLSAIGDSAAQGRAAADANAAEMKGQIVAGIAASQVKIEKLAGQMSVLAGATRKSEDAAGAEFAQAAKRMESARSILGSEPSLSAIEEAAKQAEVSTAQAELAQASLRLRASLDTFADQVKALWPQWGLPNEMPGPYAKLGADYLSDPKATKEAAQKSCLDAIDFYRKYVIPPTKPELRWSPQALMGAGYLRLYDITKDPANLKEAVTSLDEAVKDKENSPYLADAVELARIAHKLQEGPQAPAPAPAAPAPAPAPAATPEASPAPAASPEPAASPAAAPAATE
jgi:regulator of replication initiation timing